MPAPKPTSLARIAANRRNAQLSTGPKTAEGKARARANAVKHGLTGAGVALPSEDQEAIQTLFRVMQEEFAPQTVAGAELVEQMAMLTVRRHRAERAEAAHLSGRVRRAGAEFDRARTQRAGQLLEAIETQPRYYRDLLRDMPEGVDRLIAALLDLRSDLTGPAPIWTEQHHHRLDALFGFRPDDFPRNRPTRVLAGDPRRERRHRPGGSGPGGAGRPDELGARQAPGGDRRRDFQLDRAPQHARPRRPGRRSPQRHHRG